MKVWLGRFFYVILKTLATLSLFFILVRFVKVRILRVGQHTVHRTQPDCIYLVLVALIYFGYSSHDIFLVF